MRHLACIAPLLLLLALAACGKSPEERMASAVASAASGTDVSVEKDGERVVLGSGDEAMTISSGGSAQLPADFPGDVFLPDDYTVDSVVQGSGFTMVSLRTRGEVGPLADAAGAFMKSGGWNQSMMTADGETRLMMFQNDRTVAALSFDRDDEGVVYSVQLSPARQ